MAGDGQKPLSSLFVSFLQYATTDGPMDYVTRELQNTELSLSFIAGTMLTNVYVQRTKGVHTRKPRSVEWNSFCAPVSATTAPLAVLCDPALPCPTTAIADADRPVDCP